MTDKEIYSELIDIIINYGEKKDKKHGNWYKLPIFGDYYLEMDSWNKRICVNNYQSEYCYWNGFTRNKGTFYKVLGGDWGKFECDRFWVNYFLAHLGKYRKL